MINIDAGLAAQQQRRTPRHLKAGMENFSIHAGIAMDSLYEDIQRTTIRKGPRYVRGAMAEIPYEETEGILDEGREFATDLINRANLTADYEFQGSVPLNIHIQTASDLDILFIDTRVLLVQKPYKKIYSNSKPLISVKDAIKDLRRKSLLRCSYIHNMSIEDNAKSIKVCSPNLSKEIDIVPACWWDTVEYQSSLSKHERGIAILNIKNDELIKNLPFKHIFLVNQKDSSCQGSIKKLIRLLKNIKVDSSNSNKIELSSFDIASLVFSMEDTMLKNKKDFELLAELYNYMVFLRNNPNFAKNIETPDKTRRIFDNPTKFQSLNFLMNDLINLSEQLVGMENMDTTRVRESLATMRG